MNASYSPFFTSGFLSETSWASSPCQEDLVPRRGSLPAHSLHESHTSVDIDDASAFYFTLQPSRNGTEYRSYLSLDIAESMSLRSVSVSRRNTLTLNTFTFPPIPSSNREENKQSVKTLTPRQSREFLRVLPAPKPAPSITLPPRPQYASPSVKFHRPSGSVPSIVSSSTSSAPSSKRLRAQSLISPTPSVRAKRHEDALAKLESRFRLTFLSLSDDAELEPEDVVLPKSPTEKLYSFLSFSPTSRSPRSKSRMRLNSWLPLSSFIDLTGQKHERDEERLNWRSFIEIGAM